MTTAAPPAAPTRLRAARLRAELNKLGPTAIIFIVLVLLALAVFGAIQAVKAIQPNVTVVQGSLEGPAATAAPVAATELVNPLQAPGMPPVSPEARRLIKTEPGDPSRLLFAVSADLWRQMAPPFAAPGVDWCSWRLTVDRDSGHIVATPEASEGIALFDLEAGPCAPEGNGNVVAGSTTGGSIPTVSTLGPASGPSR